LKFEPVQQNLGFEQTVPGGLPWQMVPLGGSRGVLLVDAPGNELRASQLFGGDSFTFSEAGDSVSARREIWVQGRKPGRYELQVISLNGPTVIYSLFVEVFAERAVKVAFYFLPGVERRFDVDLLTRAVNEIWFGPANVSIKSLGAWGNESGETIDLPRQINIVEAVGKLREYGNHASAQWLVYFGWTIASEDKTNSNGTTIGDQTLIDLGRFNSGQIKKLAQTVAHELGHMISLPDPSHDEKKSDLMFHLSTHDGSNITIRRPRVIQVIRP
jgi:hypothetical protein